MFAYADALEKLVLYQELKKSAGRDRISEAEVTQLAAMVLRVGETVAPLLQLIPVTFEQYTDHSLRHSVNLIELMGSFIPESTRTRLNALELAVLMLAALLHDIGMVVTPEERAAFLDSADFKTWLASSDRAVAMDRQQPSVQRAMQDAALADYFRKRHPERARKIIDEHVAKYLVYGERSIAGHVKDICVSHGWGVHESPDPAHHDWTVGHLEPIQMVYGVQFSPQYTAVCLRLADIMDFDASRTPLSLLATIRDAKSLEEWKKHLSIDGFRIDAKTVAFTARCDEPGDYVAVNDFLDWIDRELAECRRLVMLESGELVNSKRYEIQLPAAVDRFHVSMSDPSFVAGAFRFELDYERIMNLLMDKSLYPDPSLFLRELLQNALDACRLRKALLTERDDAELYTPRIQVFDHSDDANDPRIEFLDNGTGMSEETVRNYFMRVGRSYYRSPEFSVARKRLADAKIDVEATSQFGIGVLSCFMVGDKLDIDTYRFGQTPLRIEIAGPTSYFVIKRLAKQVDERGGFAKTADKDSPPKFPGTRVTVHLHPGTKVAVYDVLYEFAVNVDFPITVHGDGETRVIEAWRWETEEIKVARRAILYGWSDPDDGHEVDEIVVPVDVPLHHDFFPIPVGGKAWLLLLKSPEGPVPARGYLSIASALHCIGLPKEATKLRDQLGSKDVVTLGQRIHTAEMFAEGDQTDRYGSLKSWWRAAAPEDRAKFVDYVERPLTPGGGSWLPLARDLSLGNDKWLSREEGFHHEVLFLVPRSVALHGIAVPAGFAHWAPMEGRSRHVDLPHFAAGYVLDLRGAGAPQPAASRLFIDPSAANDILVSLLRAFIRKAASLAGDGRTAMWIRWFNEFVATLDYDDVGKAAMAAESDLINEVQNLFP